MKRHQTYRYTLFQKAAYVMLACIIVFSAYMAGTLAWSMELKVKNEFTGSALGSLIISKTVENADGSVLTSQQINTKFEFIVTFSDNGRYTYTIGSGSKQIIASDGIVKLKHGQSAVINDLPVGLLYTVTEKPSAGYTVSSSNHSNHIPKGSITAAFMNTYRPDGLIISKKVVMADGSELSSDKLEQEFEFKVTFSTGDEYRYQLDDGSEHVITNDGVIKLKHGQSAKIKDIPDGVRYTVTEAHYEHYTAETYSYSGTVSTGAILPFVNVYDETPDGKEGSLELGKVVTGINLSDADKAYIFRFTLVLDNIPFGIIELKHGDSFKIENISHGTPYTVTETDYDGYTPGFTVASGTVAGDHSAFVKFINNRPDSSKSKLTVTKEVRGGDSEKKFTFTVTFADLPADPVIIMAGGEEKELSDSNCVFSFELKNGEAFDFDGLPAGITYSITETDYILDGYVQTGMTNGSGTITGANIKAVKTNTYNNNEKITISGKKTWDMSNAPSGSLPTRITVNLKGDGTKTATAEVKPNSNGEWKYSFTVPKYRADGATEIVYTIEEEQVGNWRPTVSGYDIKNTWPSSPPGPEYTSVYIKKVWQDDNNPNRPELVEVQLFRNGSLDRTVELKPSNNWSYNWTGLDSSSRWTVDETEVPGYTKTITGSATAGFTITNSKRGSDQTSSPTPTPTPTPLPDPTRDISVTKVWRNDDISNRPASVQVQLLRDGTAHGEPVILNETNGWNHKWTGLDTGPVWTVDEPEVPSGYSKTVTGDTVNGFIIYNYKAGGGGSVVETSVNVQKIWNDGQSANRPQSVNVQLYRNGAAYGGPIILTDANKWTYTWGGLDKYSSSGREVVWFVDETDVPDGYYTTITGDATSGYVIKNTEESTPLPERIALSGNKSWRHGDNPENERPVFIILHVKADGVPFTQKLITEIEHWSWSILVNKHAADGHEIVYTVDEGIIYDYVKAVNGYSLVNIYSPGDDTITIVSPEVPGSGPDGPGGGVETGDESNLLLWILLMALSIIGFTMVIILLRSKRKESYIPKH